MMAQSRQRSSGLGSSSDPAPAQSGPPDLSEVLGPLHLSAPELPTDVREAMECLARAQNGQPLKPEEAGKIMQVLGEQTLGNRSLADLLQSRAGTTTSVQSRPKS